MRRDNLRANLLLKQHQIEVDLRHVGLYNDELAHAIQEKPGEVLPLVSCGLLASNLLTHATCKFESAAARAARTILFPLTSNSEAAQHAIPNVQVLVRSGLNLQQFRDLTANTMNKLVRIPGIVISASVLSSRATKLHLQCRACRSTKIIYPPSGLGGLGGGSERGLPRTCDAPKLDNQEKDCPLDPYLIIHSKSSFTDHQTLKLQEAPDMVPVGELPRHMLLSADRYLTGQVVPGSRVIATGIYSTFQSAKNVSEVPLSLHVAFVSDVSSSDPRVPRPCEIRTCASSTSRSPHRPQVAREAQIRLVCNSRPKRRKTLVKWLAATVFTSVSLGVSRPVFTEALVCFF